MPGVYAGQPVVCAVPTPAWHREESHAAGRQKCQQRAKKVEKWKEVAVCVHTSHQRKAEMVRGRLLQVGRHAEGEGTPNTAAAGYRWQQKQKAQTPN